MAKLDIIVYCVLSPPLTQSMVNMGKEVKTEKNREIEN